MASAMVSFCSISRSTRRAGDLLEEVAHQVHQHRREPFGGLVHHHEIRDRPSACGTSRASAARPRIARRPARRRAPRAAGNIVNMSCIDQRPRDRPGFTPSTQVLAHGEAGKDLAVLGT
jgi:hypothetical protein